MGRRNVVPKQECPHCGGINSQGKGWNKDHTRRSYQCKDCKNYHYIEEKFNPQKNCENCGKPIIGRMSNSAYCSPNCGATARRRKKGIIPRNQYLSKAGKKFYGKFTIPSLMKPKGIKPRAIKPKKFHAKTIKPLPLLKPKKIHVPNLRTVRCNAFYRKDGKITQCERTIQIDSVHTEEPSWLCKEHWEQLKKGLCFETERKEKTYED